METTPDRTGSKKFKLKKIKATISPSDHPDQQAVKTGFPESIRPMLATLVDKPFDENGWFYEVKWDGYRCLAFLRNGNVNIKSRNNKLLNERFYPVVRALSALKSNAVLDGEIIVPGENGASNFGALQNWRSEDDGELLYYVFDILWLDHYDLTPLPLERRQEILKKLIPEKSIVKLSKSFNHSGIAFFESAKKLGLEGIMAKKAGSVYIPGIRSENWLKIKAGKRQEMVIGGYTRREQSPRAFSSLLVGVYDKGLLTYKGKIGTGFSEDLQIAMLRKFKPLIRKNSPFEDPPDLHKPSRFGSRLANTAIVWLKPELVCEVRFAEMTQDGLMRHPSFEGMREDKKAKTVIMEKPKRTKEIVKNAKRILTEKKIKSSGKEKP